MVSEYPRSCKRGLEIVIIAVLPLGVPSFQNTYLPPYRDTHEGYPPTLELFVISFNMCHFYHLPCFCVNLGFGVPT